MTTHAAPTADGSVRGTRAWLRFLAGFVVLWAVLQGTAAWDPTARWGVAVLAAVLAVAVLVERLLGGRGRPWRRLGFGRPAARSMVVAAVVSGAVLLVYPLAGAVTGAPITLRPDWPWLLIGVFALNGLAEEIVWRGYAFRRLRAGRSFRAAAAWTMPLIAATHVPIVLTSGPVIGLGAMAVAATTAVPLAYLFETGGGTLWAPALVHTAIDAFKVVLIPAASVATFSLLMVAVSLVVPLLALAAPRRVLV